MMMMMMMMMMMIYHRRYAADSYGGVSAVTVTVVMGKL